MKFPAQETQPDLHDFFVRESRTEDHVSVHERYEDLKKSPLYNPEYQRFYSSFTVHGKLPEVVDRDLNLVDKCADILLRAQLHDPNAQSDSEYVKSRFESDLMSNQLILESTSEDGSLGSSTLLYSRLWATIAIAVSNQPTAKVIWRILEDGYFDRQQLIWSRLPRDRAPFIKTTGTADDQLLALLAIHQLDPGGSLSGLYQRFLHQAWQTSAWSIREYFLEILVLQRCGRDAEALSRYQNLKTQGWYDPVAQVWRPVPGDRALGQAHYTHDQLLGLLVEQGLEAKGFLTADMEPFTTTQLPPPEVLHF